MFLGKEKSSTPQKRGKGVAAADKCAEASPTLHVGMHVTGMWTADDDHHG